ncbi:MAG TPA: ATPase inhibitor subunit zeta [Alphaproteobacteria bacterium]|nr:ATPase inhibitor subunit zeta [Alphaproteobacteria bacterium]
MSIRDLGKSLESKFALDQELQFKVDSYTQELVAEWVAERIGLDPETSMKFVTNMKEWGLKSGNREFRERLLADFASNQVEISENALDRLIALKSQQARKKFLNS